MMDMKTKRVVLATLSKLGISKQEANELIKKYDSPKDILDYIKKLKSGRSSSSSSSNIEYEELEQVQILGSTVDKMNVGREKEWMTYVVRDIEGNIYYSNEILDTGVYNLKVKGRAIRDYEKVGDIDELQILDIIMDISDIVEELAIVPMRYVKCEDDESSKYPSALFITTDMDGNEVWIRGTPKSDKYPKEEAFYFGKFKLREFERKNGSTGRDYRGSFLVLVNI